MTTDQNKCAHAGCGCELRAERTVMYENKAYCSERCADNRGCDHHGCNCGAFPTEVPAAPSI